MKNHEKMAPGMFYGLNFPWTEEMLLSSKFGAEWLTQAMHVAGTLSQAGTAEGTAEGTGSTKCGEIYGEHMVNIW